MTRLALAALLLTALVAPGLARAETVPGSAGARDALLAVAADATPRVAFVAADGSVVVAVRDSTRGWSEQPLPAPPEPATVVGLAVGPVGVPVVLLEASSGRWLGLAEERRGAWALRTVARAPARGLLGPAGLALTRGGSPLVAYAYRLASQKSWLRLVHENAAGRLLGEAVTRQGFPATTVPPAAAPVVLPGGAVRVVEAFSGATVEWARTKRGRDWSGQIVYANSLGSPAGVARALADPAGGVWSSWTELDPADGVSEVLLHRDGEQARVVSPHALLVDLAETAGVPEVAADDYVELGGRAAFAGLVLDPAGAAVELDGDLLGYGIDAAGGRQYLLSDGAGLAWYRAPTPATARVTLGAVADGASVVLSGSVTGAAPGGSVELWREAESGPELAATLPLAADGTFGTTDTPPAGPRTYRAVYRDPATGLPLASLVRTVLGG